MEVTGDYELKQEVFERGLQALQVSPTVDLFAHNRNNKLPNFVAREGPLAHGASAVDAFEQDWSSGLPYVFPPVQLLLRVLAKVRNENVRAVLVAPRWPSQPGDTAKDGSTGGRKRRVVAGPRDDRQPRDVAASARGDAYGAGRPELDQFEQQIRDDVKGADYVPAVDWLVAAMRASNHSLRSLRRYWHGMSDSTVRSRLHGWRVWANYCKEEGITPQRVKQEKDPPPLMTDFVSYMQEVNTPDSYRTEAMPAVKELLHMLGATEGLNQNDFVKGVIRNTTRRINHQSKYREIWDLGILLDYIRQGPPAKKLPWDAQSTITIA
jgi:hypothetical protein